MKAKNSNTFNSLELTTTIQHKANKERRGII